MKNYKTVDVMKFIFSIIVIGIHTQPFSYDFILDNAYGLVSRVAVPFFFLSSSYFLFLKYDFKTNDVNAVNNFIKRIFILYFVWSVIYFPITFNSYLRSDLNSVDWVRLYITDFLINGSYSHLWFLPNMLAGLIFTILLLKRFKIKNVLYFSLAIYIIGTTISTYEPVFIDLIPNWLKEFVDEFGTRNGIFYGFPIISLGAFLASRGREVFNKDTKFWFYILLLSFIVLGFEGIIAVLVINTSNTILWFALIPVTLSIFQLSLRIDLGDFDSSFYRKCSILIYTSHYLFIYFLQSLFESQKFGNLFLFVSATVITILFSMTVLELQKKYKFLEVLT